MNLLSIHGISSRLISILNTILVNEHPHLDRAQIGLECNLEHIRWWSHQHSNPLDVFAALAEIVSSRHISDLALKIGKTAQLTDLGMMGYAMLTSTNHERAIRIACQSLAEVNYPVIATLVRHPNFAEIQFQCNYPNPKQAKLILDIGMSSTWRYCQGLMQDYLNAKLGKVLISSDGNPGLEAYKNHYHCPVQLTANHNALIFDLGLLDLAIPTGNLQLLMDCNAHVHQLLRADIRGNNTIGHRVRSVLYERTGECAFNLNKTAKFLNLSRDQLRRQLLQIRESFRLISNEVRMDLARQYLSSSPLSIKQIALQLAYREPNNFTRAFSTQHNCSPSSYRRKHYLTN